MPPSSNTEPAAPTTAPRRNLLTRALSRSGAFLAALAAISSILALLYSAGVLHTAPPPPTPTPGAQDFAGVWDGYESADFNHPFPTKIQLLISKQGILVNVKVWAEAANAPQAGLPLAPTETATGTAVAGQVKLVASQEVGGMTITLDQWVLTLPASNTLHFTHHTHFALGAASGTDSDTDGDLHPLCCNTR
jgi:hypothetical protein